MAFQDFDLISERRRNEKKQKLRKRILIGVVSTVVVIGLIGAAFFVATDTKYFGNNNKKEEGKKDAPSESNKHVSHSQRIVKIVCSSADYKDKCEGPLNKAMADDPKLTHPKDLLKVYVKFSEDEVNKAFDKVTSSFKFESEEEKGAFEDCKQLFIDARDDLNTSTSELEKIELKRLTARTPDLNSWLSAVISFQQTCVDGFPEGKLKNDLQDLFKDSKEFISNSLAIVSQASTVLSTMQTLARGRLLLSAENSNSDNSPVASLDSDGFPSWVHSEDRRVLKAADNRPEPNVTVAKNGSGDFKTISEAIAAIPESFQGRYSSYQSINYCIRKISPN